MANITWPDWWALFATLDEVRKADAAGQVNADGAFDEWMHSRSTKVIAEVLTGAPVEVTCLYLHLLPEKDAKKVAREYPRSDWSKLSAAYYNAPKLLRSRN